MTDILGNVTRYTYSGGHVTGIKRPGSAADDITITYDANGKVSSYASQASTWTYAYVMSGSDLTATRTDAAGHTEITVSDSFNSILKSVTDENGHITSYTTDSWGRVTRVTAPEGNYTNYTYDGRGNITETRIVSKTPGNPTDIVYKAAFAVTCASGSEGWCNKPTSTTDPKNNVTTFSYNATTGQMLSVAGPTVSLGKSTTTFSYASYQAYIKNSSGGIVPTGSNISLPTSITTCRTTTTCAGSANENKTAFGYGATGVANNLDVRTQSDGNGNGSLTATSNYSYDAVGNLSTVIGPLGGGGDTTQYWYDADRRLVGVVGPDPDGGGALLNRAVRYTYDADGQVTLTERGTTLGQTASQWLNFVSLQQQATAYDGAGRPKRSSSQAAGATYSLTEYSYDNLGRVDCVAVRMNSSTFGSSAPACTLTTPGSFGSDRITKLGYDNAGQVLSSTSGYGTSLVRTDVSVSYTANGLVATLADAKNNVTSYVYDGLDRPYQTKFPGASCAVGTWTKCEQLSYDANSNISSRTLRNGATIVYSYDALNRLLSQTLPTGSGNPNPSYGYDLASNMISANNVHPTLPYSNGTSFEWDALGRKTKETSTFNGLNPIAKTFEYDLSGRQTKFSWPDGLYVTYEYDNADDLLAIREGAAGTSLFTFTYDNLGQRLSKTALSNNSKIYQYDQASRLIYFKLAGGTAETEVTLGNYSPAAAMGSRPSTNDAYSWTGAVNRTTNYVSNALNQYSSVTGTTVAYDLKDNMTKFGGKVVSFGAENTITTGGGTSYWHDALNRITFVNTTGLRFDNDGDNLVGIYAGGTVLRRYVYEPGGLAPLLWYEGTGTADRRYLDADERGSIIRISNNNGQPMRVNTYDEYGVPGPNNLGRFQYTGHVWLPEAGMYYARNRMYEPQVGRFMQTDPIGYGGGMNLYNYVGSDPINAVDPTGLEPFICGIDTCDNTSIDVVGNVGAPPSPGSGGIGSGAGALGVGTSGRTGGYGLLGSSIANAPASQHVFRIDPNALRTAAPQKTERELTCQRVNFANGVLDFADVLDAGGNKALVAAGASALVAIATSETVVGGVGFGAFATFAGAGGLLTKTVASGVSLFGNTVGALATNNKAAFQNNFMNGVLGSASSGRGGVAGGIAENAMQDAAKQPVPNRYTCP